MSKEGMPHNNTDSNFLLKLHLSLKRSFSTVKKFQKFGPDLASLEKNIKDD